MRTRFNDEKEYHAVPLRASSRRRGNPVNFLGEVIYTANCPLLLREMSVLSRFCSSLGRLESAVRFNGGSSDGASRRAAHGSREISAALKASTRRDVNARCTKQKRTFNRNIALAWLHLNLNDCISGEEEGNRGENARAYTRARDVIIRFPRYCVSVASSSIKV